NGDGQQRAKRQIRPLCNERGQLPCLQPLNDLKKEQHASRETWYQAPRAPQKDTGARKWLLLNKIEAVPLGERVGRARAEVRLQRPQAEEAPVPFHLDCAHWRCRQAERHQLQQVHQRSEEGWYRTRPQDPRRSGSPRSGWIYGTVQAGAGRSGIV